MATATATMDNTKAMLEELRKPPEAVLDQIIGKKVDGTVKWVSATCWALRRWARFWGS
jgi:hypothetical protein